MGAGASQAAAPAAQVATGILPLAPCQPHQRASHVVLVRLIRGLATTQPFSIPQPGTGLLPLLNMS